MVMKEITLKIPQKNFDFFMQLIKQLGYVEVKKEVTEVPEHHKKIIGDRLKSMKKQDLLDWEKVKNDFNFD
jgi:hypothetical protein